MGKNAIDLTDKTFGRLTVIKRVPSHKKAIVRIGYVDVSVENLLKLEVLV